MKAVLDTNVLVSAALAARDLRDGSSTFVRVHNVPMGCRDPNDDKVIETAMNGDVDFVVSDDADVFEPRASFAIAKTGAGIRRRPIRVVSLHGFVAELTGMPRFSPLVAATPAA